VYGDCARLIFALLADMVLLDSDRLIDMRRKSVVFHDFNYVVESRNVNCISYTKFLVFLSSRYTLL